MPIQGTVPVGGSFAPTDAADSFGTHNDKWGVGGYRIVKTLTDRNNIPVNESNLLNLDDTLASGRRKLGMMVYVSDEDKFYVLTIPQATWNGYNEGQKVTALANNANFAEFSAGGSPLTTKGDLYTFSTLNARLPVGDNNQILAADSTEPTGLKWINVPATVTPSTLTKTDDTNVTLTLGGTPATALLQAVSLTLGWSGTLADSRIASASNWNTAYGWGNHASVGYITTISGISAGGDLSGTYTNPTVAKIQGQPISELDPTNGQVLQWNGTSWTPGAIPTGGTGGGGVVYYLNFNTTGEVPLTNIPQTPTTTKELGLSGEATPTSYQSAHLSTGSYDFLASFVTDVGFPSAETIPAGIWDFNIFAESTSTNSANQVYFQVKIYKYDDTETLTLLGTSSDVYIYDPAEINQYVASIIVTQTTLLETDRIVVYLYGRSHQSNKNITFHFGGSYPSHVHTTLSSVSGTGFVTVTNGIFDPVASNTINVNKLTAGTANQVIRMPNSDGDPAWGAINLASSDAVTGTLAIGNGGTGFASYAIGDLLYANTTTSLAKLAGVAAGSVLISNGTNTAPSWSTGPTLRSIILNNASNANTITLNTGVTSTSYTITLPTAAATGAQYLQTTGAGGTLQWTSGTTTGISTIGTYVNGTGRTNGALISGSVLTFGAATASFPGMVDTGTQTFAGAKTFSSAVTISAVNSQIVLGTTNTTTITSPAPAASRVYTIPDVLANASFVMTQGAQTITGIKTFVSSAGPIQFNDISNVSTPTAGATPSLGTRIVIAPGDATPNTPLSLGINTSYEFWMAGRFQLTFYPRNQTTSVAAFDYVTTGNGTTGLILSSTYSNIVPALRSTGWIFAAGASAGAAVSTGTRSAGTKIVLRDNIGFVGDASIGTTESSGANTTEMWFTSPSRIAFYTNNVTNNKLVITSTGVTVTSDVGFYATSPQAKPTVTGAKGGNAALTSLCTALATLGLITNSTT